MFYKRTYFLFIVLVILLISDILVSKVNIPLQNPSYYKDHTKEGIIFLYHDNYAKSVYLKSNFDDWRLRYRFKKVNFDKKIKVSYRSLTPPFAKIQYFSTNDAESNDSNSFNENDVWNGWWGLKLPITFERFQLKKGRHTYKLVIDNEFISDPRNPNSMDDGMGNLISYFDMENDIVNYKVQTNPSQVLDEENYYRFIFKNYKAKQVYLVGNFNHWNSYSHPLTNKGDGIWFIKIKLPKGKYYYNFIVDDQWTKDPLNIRIERNVIGKVYSVFEVKD